MRTYLDEGKQYLVSRRVRCSQRVVDLQRMVGEEEEVMMGIEGEEEEGEGWLVPHLSNQTNQQHKQEEHEEGEEKKQGDDEEEDDGYEKIGTTPLPPTTSSSSSSSSGGDGKLVVKQSSSDSDFDYCDITSFNEEEEEEGLEMDDQVELIY